MINVNVEQYLRDCSTVSDSSLALGLMVLHAQFPEHEGLSFDRYFLHLEQLSNEVAERFALLLQEGAEDDAGTRLAALKHVFYDIHAYNEEGAGHEVLEDADLFRVIDRGCGGTAALAVLYIHAARVNGWEIEGLDFPGRFLCRMNLGAARVIFDPSCPSHILAAHDLRAIVKSGAGEQAELSPEYLEGFGVRDVFVHVCNLLKDRYIEMGDYESALAMNERMFWAAPDVHRLLFDAGVLYMRQGMAKEARARLQSFVDVAPDSVDRDEASLLIRELE